MTAQELKIVIAVPLEKEHVEAIRTAHPTVEVSYDPELLPPERFPADHSGDPSFRRTPEQEERYWKLLNSADILYGFPNDTPEGFARVVGSNPSLRWVHATAAGAGGTVKASGISARDLGRVTVTSSAGIHSRPLAEFAIMGVLNGFKGTATMAGNQRSKDWPELRTPTRLLAGSHLVIAGLGEIGLETAHLARALGMTVSGTKRSIEPIDGIERVANNDQLAELVSTADALINTLPGTPYTEKLIDSNVFAAMRPGTAFVNVGRGTVVDEDALLTALNDGQVGYACLDVFAVEPLPADSPLWENPNVLVSPHTSALTTAENRLIAERFRKNLDRFLDGHKLIHEVDPVHFY